MVSVMNVFDLIDIVYYICLKSKESIKRTIYRYLHMTGLKSS